MFKYVIFPFDKVEKNSKVIIYGGGEIGRDFIHQLKSTSYCEIVCVVDNEINEEKIEGITCIKHPQISKYSFDYVVIASIMYREEIYQGLVQDKISESKIVSVQDENINLCTSRCSSDESQEVVSKTPSNTNWKDYYEEAEKVANEQVNLFLYPIMKKYNLLNRELIALDFACGWGRIANLLRVYFGQLICSDISKDAIEHCNERFRNDQSVIPILNTDKQIQISDDKFDVIYSWDAMVHFMYRDIDRYIKEFYRFG